MDLRIIAADTGSEIVLAHVGHHDEAYRWAETHRPVVDSDAKLVSVLPELESVAGPPREGARIAREADQMRVQLLAAGLPPALAAALSPLSEEELLDVIGWLAPELQEPALAALVGAETAPSSRPARPSDVLVIKNDQILEFALALPAETWRVFLHPKQRYIVDLPGDHHVLVRGGPGTGKTVAMVHRFARLCHETARAEEVTGPVLIVLNRVTREILTDQLAKLGVASPGERVRLVSDLPRSRARLARALNRWTHVVVDEGQDLPIELVSAICELVESGEGMPPLTISYDANQAIFHPSESALARLRTLTDGVTLTYCYRATKQIADAAGRAVSQLHTKYGGRDFQSRHRIAGGAGP